MVFADLTVLAKALLERWATTDATLNVNLPPLVMPGEPERDGAHCRLITIASEPRARQAMANQPDHASLTLTFAVFTPPPLGDARQDGSIYEPWRNTARVARLLDNHLATESGHQITFGRTQTQLVPVPDEEHGLQAWVVTVPATIQRLAGNSIL